MISARIFAPRARARFEIFQRENRRAFAREPFRCGRVEGPAFFRRRRLERIETDKDQLGERIVAAGEDALVAARADAFEGMPDRVRAGSAGIRDDLARGREAERFLRVHDRLLRR